MMTKRALAPRLSKIDKAVELFASEFPMYVVAILASLFILLIAATVFWSTFVPGLPRFSAHLSLSNYGEALGDPLTAKAGLNSLWLSLGTVAINLFFALPLGWLIHRTDVPWKAFFTALVYLTLMIPGFLNGIAWIILLSPKIGIINQLLKTVGLNALNIYGITGMAFVQGLVLTPPMFFMISPALLAFDSSLEEAAEVSGLNKMKVLLHVSVPLLLPVLLAAVIYNFMTAMAMFEIPALLGLPARIYVLSTLMFTTVHSTFGLPNYGLAGVDGLLLVIPMLVALMFYQRLLKSSYRYVVVSGRGYRPKQIELGSWKWVGVGFILLYFLLALFLPLLTLIWTSITPFIAIPSRETIALWNFQGYRQAVSALTQWDLLFNTGMLVFTVALGVLLISVAVSWIVLRSRLPGKYVIDTVSMLPHGIPTIAISFAIGFVAVAVSRWIPIHGSLATIMLAHIVAYVSFGTRNIQGGLIQIHRELDEAGRVCGLSIMSIFRRITLPLLAPALFYGGLWVALLSYREVTMALFLQGPRNNVLTTTIWQFWANSNTATTSALGLILFATVGIGVGALLRISSVFFYSPQRNPKR